MSQCLTFFKAQKNNFESKILFYVMFGGLEKGRLGPVLSVVSDLSTLTTDTAGKLDVLWHDGDTLGVDSAQVGVLEKTNKVSFRSFLKSHDSRALET